MVEVATQPFSNQLPITQPGMPVSGTHFHWPAILLSLWLCGFLTVVLIWTSRWLRISASIRNSVPLTEGREFAALRRLESLAARPKSMNILLSPSSIEPGVFGILTPVLLWPQSISEHLDDAHLDAVIAHELCHVRRRDNLVAAVHMFVEAIFWFHPLVWWMGARLIAERELACDEAVLELGSRPATYAESILKVCEFCLSSPLTCVSGVTGSDLKKRMVHIMTDRVAHKLNLARKLLLWTAACLAVALPITFGLLNVTPIRANAQIAGARKFSSVSIKPHSPEANGVMMTKMMMPAKPGGGFVARGASLHSLIQGAYRVEETQIVGEPDWAKSKRYDIDANVGPSFAEQTSNLSEMQRGLVTQQMLQQLLANYFKLGLHQESRDMPVYELVVADGGPKLQKANGMHMMRMGMGELNSQGTPMDLLVTQLSQRLGRTVVDKTGLKGEYVFNLHWTPDADEQARIRAAAPGLNGPGAPPQPAFSGPPLMTAIEQQLGLKLQSTTDRVPVLVIDHAEQPGQN